MFLNIISPDWPSESPLKFLFVLMEIPSRFLMATHFAQGIGSLSALLKREGHDTDLLRVGDIIPEEISGKVREFDPDIIGISASSCFAGKLPGVVEQLQRDFNGPIILGGVQPPWHRRSPSRFPV